MQKIWERIEAWLYHNAQDVFHSLQRPATEAQLREVEVELGLVLPEDVRTSYLIHNGQKSTQHSLLGSMWHLLSLQQALREWRLNNHLLEKRDYFSDAAQRPPRELRPVWWSAGWFPVAANGAGDFVCVDLASRSRDQIGQLFIHWHDSDIHTLIAPNYYTWLRRFADDLESQRYSLFEHGLVRDTDIWVSA